MARSKKKSRAKPKAASPRPKKSRPAKAASPRAPKPRPDSLEYVKAVFKKHRRNLLRRKGVQHVSYGAKHRDEGGYHFAGEKTVLAIIVYVEDKKDQGTLKRNQMIPESLDGVPTDVIRVPIGKLAAPPLVGGIEIAPQTKPAAFGTLGLVVTDNVTKKRCLLTCAHVAYGSLDPAAPGGPITQPASGAPADVVGTPLRNGMVPAAGQAAVDAAIIELNGSREVQPGVIHAESGKVTRIDDADFESRVAKWGAKTDRTAGKVVDPNAMLQVGSHSFFGLLKVLRDDGQLFVQGGDSGAALFLDPPEDDPDGPFITVVGLLIAKDEDGGPHGYAVPIREVFRALDLRLPPALS